ncbi:UDP-N-acetylglucosamine 1-carboxyvinyltransferase [Thermotoga maritima MSB8]|uniref:UDP-N-acetylglucosamine 1-carboxyvinyltransferase n=1 Tax=Thermotoga maritima (strain ATCC 43589 / DSM 3109 / JCM 10099 / NBRC 100826 / MSB8) TaxID=243274 RepID=MURA_THEMA|nr:MULTISPECIES: UDP-N-acetylglucosamine 1-carboxyvinyltransferase [Thermotoga]Q9WXW3.1 RecName: Full=UDP-N-acetylglucosamine 1-carboxyvinyltransferase; AltName: Full=Enoylpyruvate transferase; AltName: Full=UDP-N-acetylglucosamine enolpyruvyl transferase; Short=EPT [Thermotoga maritima MSB8]AAD35202.1 UDP-N-acetylglucosamine 1-carboxyvinyltransferase [Thermotoga maritima MSB8]AGL49031.1 UDP-N-acetylglucosamine 1-carboxyvinyltransferase [Thermotoga maritima MSB8]AHD18123.1 UDP-N-acetylglucosami
MGKLVVQGGAVLEGEVEISGSKNAALPIMAAAILCDEEVILKNVPRLQDVFVMIDILRSIGFRVEFEENELKIKRENDISQEVPYELVRKMRASFNVLGPIAVRTGRAKVALPGGCSIGVRPVDFHLEGLKKMGFSIKVEHGFVEACFERRIDYVTITLPFPSVGATEHLMTTAALLKGARVVIENAAMEPEIVDLQNFINRMGGHIEGAGTSRIVIEGVEKMQGVEYSIIPDRIEAGTYLVAIAASRGKGLVKNVNPDHLTNFFEKLEETGAKLKVLGNEVEIEMRERPKAVDVTTNPYPGFPTDLQPQMMAYLSTASGVSVITENVFKTRFLHVDELKRMGADIEVSGNVAIVKGVEKLSGAPVEGTDLRATAALLIAGIIADGVTEISNVEHIFRGYEDVIDKFSELGAKIEYVEKEN